MDIDKVPTKVEKQKTLSPKQQQNKTTILSPVPMDIDSNIAFNFENFNSKVFYTGRDGYIVFRATKSDPKLTQEPRFFSSLNNTRSYFFNRGDAGKVFACRLKDDITLYNIKHLGNIVKKDFYKHTDSPQFDQFVNRFFKYVFKQAPPPVSKTILHDFIKRSFDLALGNMSCSEQLEFLNNTNIPIPEFIRKHYISKFQLCASSKTGFRLSWTHLDDMMVAFFQLAYGNECAGYIAPALPQPDGSFFHEEICLFNPSESISASHEIKIGGTRRKHSVFKGGKEGANLPCKLSTIEPLKVFIGCIFVRFVKLMFVSFDILVTKSYGTGRYHNKVVYESLYDILKETFAVTKDGSFQLIKPGLPARTDADKATWISVIEQIASQSSSTDTKSQSSKSQSQSSKSYLYNDILSRTDISLQQLMGAVYGAVVNHGVFFVIFRAAFEDITRDDLGMLRHLRNKLSIIVATFRDIFALGNSFDTAKFFKLLSTNCSRAPNQDTYAIPIALDKSTGCFVIDRESIHRVLLDMMIFEDKSIKTIVTRNLNNLEYVRKRVPRDKVGEYTKVSRLAQGSCPKFTNVTDDKLEYIVQGDTWYSVDDPSTNLYARILHQHNKTPKAGPSGSTFMWMNFVFELMGYRADIHSMRLLLMCIVADFVPNYHSLDEVLHIFSREVGNYIASPLQPFTYDQNAIHWFRTFLLGHHNKRASSGYWENKYTDIANASLSAFLV